MSKLDMALKIADKEAVFSLNRWWLDCRFINAELKTELINNGWTEEKLISTWLIAPSSWKSSNN